MMRLHRHAWLAPLTAVIGAVCLATAARPLAAPDGDLDQLMQQVLANRDDNWKKLQQYILDEREEIQLLGPAHSPLWGERREYTWYLRDGFFVRSPLKVNGAAIGDAERRKYEDDFLRREEKRDGRAGPQASQPAPAAADGGQPPADVNSLIRQTRQPEFISSAYFLRFKFDEGRYAFVGRETLDGREALRIEYYPTKLFAMPARRTSPGDPGRGWQSGPEPQDEQLRVLMNKASLVTLWIDPASRQIMKFTIDNVTPNFLPANWLGRMTDGHASMTMGEPFPGVWLPRGVDMRITLTLALGAFDFRYAIDYADYRRADVTSTLHAPDPR